MSTDLDKVKSALAAMRADCWLRHVPKLLAVAEAAVAYMATRREYDQGKRGVDEVRDAEDQFEVEDGLRSALDAALAALAQP